MLFGPLSDELAALPLADANLEVSRRGRVGAVANRINALCMLLSVRNLWPKSVLQATYDLLQSSVFAYRRLARADAVSQQSAFGRHPPPPASLQVDVLLSCLLPAGSLTLANREAAVAGCVKQLLSGTNLVKTGPATLRKRAQKHPEVLAWVKAAFCGFCFGARPGAEKPVGVKTWLGLAEILGESDEWLFERISAKTVAANDPLLVVALLEFIFSEVAAHPPLEARFAAAKEGWWNVKRCYFSLADGYRQLLSKVFTLAPEGADSATLLDAVFSAETSNLVEHAMVCRMFKKSNSIKLRAPVVGPTLRHLCRLGGRLRDRELAAYPDLLTADHCLGPLSLSAARALVAECGGLSQRALYALFLRREISLTPLPRALAVRAVERCRERAEASIRVLACLVCGDIKSFFMESEEEKIKNARGFTGVCFDADAFIAASPAERRERTSFLRCQSKRGAQQQVNCGPGSLAYFEVLNAETGDARALSFFGRSLVATPCCGFLAATSCLRFSPEGVVCAACATRRSAAERPVETFKCAYCESPFPRKKLRLLSALDGELFLCAKHNFASVAARAENATRAEVVSSIYERVCSRFNKRSK